MNNGQQTTDNGHRLTRFRAFLRGYCFLLILFFILLTPAILIQNRELNIIRKQPRRYRDSLYLPSGENIHLLSVGYDMFMADFLWLRSIQAFGGHWETDRNYRPLFHLFDVITDLDAHFIEAYTFGNLVIGDEGGNQELGLKLINKGILKNPRKYKLPYWAGYVAYWTMNNPVLAKYYYGRAVKCPDAPGFVRRLLAYMELKSGRYRVAFEKYLRDLLDALDKKDSVVEGIARSRIFDVVNEWQMFNLRQAVDNYVKMTGRAPKNIHDLEPSGALKPYRRIVIPILFGAVNHYARQPGKLLDHFQDILNAAICDKAMGIPPHPRGYWYQLHPFLKPEDEYYIVDGEDYVRRLSRFLGEVRLGIVRFHRSHGRYPYTITELYGEPLRTPEFFGGEWIYYPFDGSFFSSTMPFL